MRARSCPLGIGTAWLFFRPDAGSVFVSVYTAQLPVSSRLLAVRGNSTPVAAPTTPIGEHLDTGNA